MKVLVFGASAHSSFIASALMALERHNHEVIVIDSMMDFDKITGKDGKVVLIDDMRGMEDMIALPFLSDPEPCASDHHRRRSKGDKHRNRKHRWSAG